MLPDPRPLAVQNENIRNAERGNRSGSTVLAHKLNFDAVRRQKLDHRADIAHLTRRIIGAVQHSHQVQQFRLSRLWHIAYYVSCYSI